MKKHFLLIIIFFFAASSIAQTVYINEANYLKKRVSQGLIEDGRIHRMNFEDCNMKKVAILYWPENNISKYKTGITIFENKRIEDSLNHEFCLFAQITVKEKFENLSNYKFELIGGDSTIPIEKYFTKKNGFKPFSTTELGKEFLQSLSEKGFDGLIILFEDDIPDAISQVYESMPAKGLYKNRKQYFVYHSLRSIVFDLNKGKPVKNIGYLQLSADHPSQKMDKHFKEVDLKCNPIFLADLKLRFENNIDEIIKVFKLVK